jgi:GT2 family glycosyltransferase
MRRTASGSVGPQHAAGVGVIDGRGSSERPGPHPPGGDAVAARDPLVTLLTVTHERPAKVRALLASILASGTGLLRKIVIVDDSAEPPNYPEEFPSLPIEHLRLPQRVFISHAKNVGLEHVQSEFVFFVDDDNLLDAESIREPLRRLSSDPTIGGLMPAVLYHRDPGVVWVYSTPFHPGRWSFDLVGRNLPRDPTKEGRLLPTDALPNSSLIRTAAARAIGGFDRTLPVNSSADFCQRLKHAGWEVWADTGAFVRHDVELPSQRAFWAGHSSDARRLFYEVHDWFLFHRRLRIGERAVRPRTLWHALPFLLAQELAFALRRDTRLVPLTVVLIRGVTAGLSEPVGPT